jgi:RimJ/RimL family protein N-acetyltransferase
MLYSSAKDLEFWISDRPRCICRQKTDRHIRDWTERFFEASIADMEIETDRLILRRWQSSDVEPFVTLNADPRVMQFFPATLSRAETEALISSVEEKFTQHGFGLWAAELKATAGFIGLNVPGYPLLFSPCVEIGWRLAFDYWGKGYAQEGARAALAFGFGLLHLEEIVSITTANNLRSRQVMDRIGMTYDARGDFDHPKLPDLHPLRRHVLYRKVRTI